MTDHPHSKYNDQFRFELRRAEREIERFRRMSVIEFALYKIDRFIKRLKRA